MWSPRQEVVLRKDQLMSRKAPRGHHAMLDIPKELMIAQAAPVATHFDHLLTSLKPQYVETFISLAGASARAR